MAAFAAAEAAVSFVSQVCSGSRGRLSANLGAWGGSAVFPPGVCVQGVLRRRTICVFTSHRTFCSAWQPPGVDCYALLGVPRSASASEIRQAYLEKAKSAHPDAASTSGRSGGGCADTMVQLNLCYEALTQRRRDYDASRWAQQNPNAGGRASSRGAYGAGQEAWWSNRAASYGDGGSDFDGIGADWEEVFRRNHARHHQRQQHAPRSHSRGTGQSWRQWAEAWGQEDAAASRHSAKQQPKYDPSSIDDEDSEDSSDDEAYSANWREARSRSDRTSRRAFGQRAAGRRSSAAVDEEEVEGDDSGDGRGRSSRKRDRDQHRDAMDAPVALWLELGGSKGKAGQHGAGREVLTGRYGLMEQVFNGRCAYMKGLEVGASGPTGRRLYMFWSRAFGDWKVAERLEDDGVCLAYMQDKHGVRPPWALSTHRSPQWCIWDPASRRYVSRKLRMYISDDPEDATASAASDEADEDEVPWSRPSLSDWPTSELVRWCEARGVSLAGCFDREAILEKVLLSVRQNGNESSDQDRWSRHAAGRNRNVTGQSARSSSATFEIRLASRMKTDGSYTKPPSLDKRISLYGNRVERFRGDDEDDVYSWLYEHGDPARLYGIFWDGEFSHSLVWKRGKEWGRIGQQGQPSSQRRRGGKAKAFAGHYEW